MIYRTALFSLALVGLLAIGCSGNGATESAPSATPTATETVDSPESQAAEPTEAPETEQPVDDAGEDAAAQTDAALDFVAIEDAPGIRSYRSRVDVQAETARGNDIIQVMGEYTKEPPAEQLVIDIQDSSGETVTMQMLRSDGAFYMQAGDVWMQSSDDRPGLREITLIEPADAAAVDAQFERVGAETINGRETIHYRGGPESVPVGGTPGDTFDVTGVASARIDLWIDQADNFITRMEVSIEGDDSDPDARYFMSFEYYDFNADIQIEAPEVMGGAPMPDPDTSAMPTTAPAAPVALTPKPAPADPQNDLSALGLDLALPADATILMATPNVMQFSTALSADEAAAFIEQTAQDNGYSLINKTVAESGDLLQIYQAGTQTLTFSFAPQESGAEVTVATAP